MSSFENFDLHIGPPQEGRYPVSVQASPAGESEAAAWVALDPEEPTLQPLLDALQAGTISLEALQALGRHLAGVLLPPGPVRDLYHRSQGLTEARQSGLRLRLRLATTELAALPWEYSYDEQIADFLVLNPRTALVRYHSQPMAPQPITQPTPVPILLLISNPPPTEPLDSSKECEGLLAALAPLLERKQVTVDILYGGPEEERAEIEAVVAGREGIRLLPGLPSLDRLRDLLREGYRVLHYIGHGSFEAEQGGVLLLTDAVGELSIASAQMLARELRGSRVAVVLLNSCQSAAEGSARSFMGLAPTLIRAGVPAVVAMQLSIADRSASCFSRGLYEALADGLPLDRAVTEGRKAIGSSGERPELDWGIPVLFMRSPDGVLWQVEELSEDSSDIPPCPYPGMKPFTEADAGRFYGREKTVQEMLDRFRLQPFLALIGPSGSGKSSLLHAGLLPELRQSRLFPASEWRVISMRPGPQPIQRLAALLAPPQGNSDELAEALTRNPARLPDDLAAFMDALPAGTHCLMLVDQFEELFTQCKEAEQRQRFLQALRHLIEHRPERCLLLLAIRADFLGNCQESLLWPHIEAGLIHLPPLAPGDLRRAIVEPARAVGVELEPALVERLLADAEDEKGALPLLQETLFLLWSRFLRERRLTLADYEALGSDGRTGLQVALSRQADAALAALPGEEQRAIARRIFLRLIEFGPGRNDTRRQQPLGELFPQPDDSPLFREVLDQLIQSRLLISSHDEATHRVVVDLTHEMLITGWPRLQQWLDSYETMEVTRRSLALSATAWKENGEEPSYLYTGKRLAEAEQWAAQWEQEIDPREKQFLAASHAWSLTQQRQQQQRRVGLIAIALVGLLVLALAGWVGQREWTRRSSGSALVPIAGGPAMIGSEPRRVTLLPFQMEKSEVSNRQYRACVEAGPCEPPLLRAAFDDPTLNDLPVISLTAQQAQQYCAWLGRRLPTVVEWERAARGQGGRKWPWGESEEIENYQRPTQLVAVESEPETSTPPPEQLFHLGDNVSEWATLVPADCEGAACHEPWDGEADVAIIGSAYDRFFSRFVGEFEQSSSNLPDESIGFRCVKEAP